MKKRIVAFLVAVVMVIGLVVPASAEYQNVYQMQVEGQTVALDDGSDGMAMTIKIKAPTIQGTSLLLLSIDKSKLELAGKDGTLMTAPTNEDDPSFYPDDFTEESGWQAAYTNSKFRPALFLVERDNRSLLMISMEATSPVTRFDAEFDNANSDAYNFYLKLATDVDYADLDNTAIRLATFEETMAFNQPGTALICNDADEYVNGTVVYSEGVGSDAHETDTLMPPQIMVNGEELPRALGSVTLTMDKAAVNAPALYPAAEAPVTVSGASASAVDKAGLDFTDEDGVAYTYSLQVQDGENAADLTTEQAGYFSIDADNGDVTIQPGAPITTLVVNAEGSYTNTAGTASTATGSAELKVCHGNAKEDGTGEDPGVDPADVQTLNGLELYKDNSLVASTMAGSDPYEETAGKPAAGSTTSLAFEAVEVDQWGAAMSSAKGSWGTISETDGINVTTTAGTLAIVIDDTAVDTVDPLEYTYTADTFAATIKLSVSDTVISWPEITVPSIVYGQTMDELTITGGSVMTNGEAVTDAAFAWDDTTTVYNATEGDGVGLTVTMNCTYGKETATKDYVVEILKADQTITMDDVDVNIGEAKTLAASVVNATTDGVVGTMGALSYAPAAGVKAFTVAGDQITGVSQDETGDAKVVVTAAGTANYNEATAAVTVKVYYPKLDVNIAFDTTAPIFGAEITATVTESESQAGSLIDGMTYQWGFFNDEGKFEALGHANTSGNLTVEADSSATVVYIPVKEDIGKTLMLQIITPSTKPEGYIYADSDTETMAAPVTKASQTAPSLKTTVATTTITVEAVAGAEYAIQEAAVSGVAEGDGLAWQDSNEFTGLQPNTAYTVYVRMKETETHAASDITSTDITTSKIDITPDDPANPGANDASVALSGAEMFGETLTATVANPKEADGTTEIPVFNTNAVYKWFRTADGVETEISGAADSTYTLVAADVGCTITVKVEPDPDGDYTGSVTATSAAIAKAPGPDFTGEGIETTKASSASIADGKITGLDADVIYEYRLKAETGEEEAAWISVTASSTTIENLVAGTYEIRIAATVTHEASDSVEKVVEVLGYSITGKLESYNALHEITYKLYAWDEESGAYSNTVAYEGTLIEAQETTTDAKQTNTFEIEAIADGTYKLVISKMAHLDYTVLNIAVNGADVNLTTHTNARVSLMVMGVGDLNHDGVVNATDKNTLMRSTNFNKTVATEEHKVVDINGDGVINTSDKNILTRSANFNKNTNTHFTVDAANAE